MLGVGNLFEDWASEVVCDVTEVLEIGDVAANGVLGHGGEGGWARHGEVTALLYGRCGCGAHVRVGGCDLCACTLVVTCDRIKVE